MDQAASAPAASVSTSRQCFATNSAAWSLISAKSPPTRVRAIVASGFADHNCGVDLYFETLPARRMKAQSVLAVLQADNRNTVAIRSGPSCSSMIVSAKRTYFGDRAAIEAPAEKVLESIDTAISRGGLDFKACEQVGECVMLASHHWCHDSAAGPADTRSNRPREGEPSYATSSAATDGFLHGCAARERDSYGNDKCERLHRYFPEGKSIFGNF